MGLFLRVKLRNNHCSLSQFRYATYPSNLDSKLKYTQNQSFAYQRTFLAKQFLPFWKTHLVNVCIEPVHLRLSREACRKRRRPAHPGLLCFLERDMVRFERDSKGFVQSYMSVAICNQRCDFARLRGLQVPLLLDDVESRRGAEGKFFLLSVK